MDSQVRSLFDTLHSIIGIDTPQKRDQLFEQFERKLAERIVQRARRGMSAAFRARYGEFLKQTPAPTAAAGAHFIESLLGRAGLEKLVREETQAFTREYLRQLLAGVTGDQQAQLKAAVAKVLSIYPQG